MFWIHDTHVYIFIINKFNLFSAHVLINWILLGKWIHLTGLYEDCFHHKKLKLQKIIVTFFPEMWIFFLWILSLHLAVFLPWHALHWHCNFISCNLDFKSRNSVFKSHNLYLFIQTLYRAIFRTLYRAIFRTLYRAIFRTLYRAIFQT